MFESLINMIKISFTLKPVSPLLIKSGRESIDPTLPDMNFVKASTPYGGVVYIPGSSLKGVIRSRVEKYLVILGKNTCASDRIDCGEKLQKEVKKYSGNEIYGKLCYSCRLFGSTVLASSFKVSDLFPYKDLDYIPKSIEKMNQKLKIKMGNSIDKKSGTAKNSALYDMEVLTSGTFYGELLMKNSEKWQLALILKAIQDINSGFQRVGFGKSRGLGHVNISIESLEFLSSNANMPTFANYNDTDKKFYINIEDEDQKYFKRLGDDILGGKFVVEKEAIESLTNYFIEKLTEW